MKTKWKARLHNVYDSFDEFCGYDHTYAIAKRLGYKNVFTAWKANPLIQGSINPNDLRKVKK